MRKTLIIARKELISTFRQPNMLLLMLLMPMVMVVIIGLAFGGLVGDTPDFAEIRVAVVNLDEGVNLNPALQPGLELTPGSFSFNFGDRLAALLLSQPFTSTSANAAGGGFNPDTFACPLLPDTESAARAEDAFAGWLDDLLDAVPAGDPAAARAGVERGDYAVAVLIPPDFSRRLAPSYGLDGPSAPGTVSDSGADTTDTVAGAVEVFANNGSAISASIVRAVVEAAVSRFERAAVALDALAWTAADDAINRTINNTVNNAVNSAGDAAAHLEPDNLLTRVLQAEDASVPAPLACLWTSGAGPLQVQQQPLDQTQTQSPFAILMVMVGSSQAVFFALFTGVFGVNSIYEDRIQGTLQRLLVTPTPSSAVLAGRLLGNLVIVMSQLLILFFAFTALTSLVERKLTFIWGPNPLALLLVVMGLSLFTTGLGALVVGLAQTSQQVQVVGPLISIVLGVVGGSFTIGLPRQVTQLSPIWWGLEAIRKLAAHETDIGPYLLALFVAGFVFAGAGTYFFRRRMGL